MRIAAWVAMIGALGCSSPKPPPSDLDPAELALRAKLGIPDDAEHVVVFSQSSHLDIDWQHTFVDYYDLFVGNLFVQARQILDDQPRAVYSIAEMAFLQYHLQQHPEELAPLLADSQRGALRIVGGGMTSPDTLLPETEMLARDFLYGIQFAEETLDAHPTAVWLPDSFGHGAGAPDLLTAAGYTSVGFSRIDGAPALNYQLNMPNLGNLPGSTAAALAALGTDDFVWQGAGGAQLLAHFMSGTGLYCEGDNLDYNELLEPAGSHIGPFEGDDPTFTDGKVDAYIAQLAPLAPTPYMFVPVGCDFASPKPDLIKYLDGYDARRSGSSHVYAVAASFEDFEALVNFHRAALPTVTNELSPYYMGFFGSRADLKRQTRDAARPFFTAEVYATLLGAAGTAIVVSAAPTLSTLTRTDHHDFVTGTSTDAVVATEQLPLLASSLAAGTAELAQVADAVAAQIPASAGTTSRVLALAASTLAQTAVAELDVPTSAGAVPVVHAIANGAEIPIELIATPASTDTVARFRALASVPAFGWQAIDVVPGAAQVPAAAVTLALLDGDAQPATGDAIVRVVLSNAHVRAQWDRGAGGAFALTSVVIDGAEAIAQASMVTQDYADDGGLWRLGNEMTAACKLAPIAPTPTTDTVQILAQGNLAARVAFVGADATREAALDAASLGLDLAITTGAAISTTRTVTITLAAPAGAQLTTSVPGGAAVRPAQRVYTPTFWAAVGFAQVGGWAVLLRQSTGVRMDTAGALELMAARDAEQEVCDLEGGSGSDPGTHRLEWRLVPAATAAAAEQAAQVFDRPLALVAVDAAPTSSTLATSGSVISIAGDAVISTVKPAERGAGVIVRAQLYGPATVMPGAALAGRAANLVDLAERDHDALGSLALDPATLGAIVSVRLQ